MQLLLQISTELIMGFIILLIITKLLGKTQITHLTPFDFISSLVLGELVGAAVYEKEVGVGFILFAVALWAVLVYVVEKISQKFRRTRGILDGRPSILIRDTKIDKKELAKNKMDINQLLSLLRQRNIFSVQDVTFAILEPNGKISVLEKPKTNLTYTLISDGEVNVINLKETGCDEKWLKRQLETKGVSEPKHVLYAEWNHKTGIHVQKYNESIFEK